MRSMKKVTRLLELHDSLLKMREWEQKQHAQAYQDAESRLQSTLNSIQEASDMTGVQMTGGDALQWRFYMDLLEEKKKENELAAMEKRVLFEESQKETMTAYQEKEKWQLQKTHLSRKSLKDVSDREIRSADELALQRYIESNREVNQEGGEYEWQRQKSEKSPAQ